jgi:hypothetical protein
MNVQTIRTIVTTMLHAPIMKVPILVLVILDSPEITRIVKVENKLIISSCFSQNRETKCIRTNNTKA